MRGHWALLTIRPSGLSRACEVAAVLAVGIAYTQNRRMSHNCFYALTHSLILKSLSVCIIFRCLFAPALLHLVVTRPHVVDNAELFASTPPPRQDQSG